MFSKSKILNPGKLIIIVLLIGQLVITARSQSIILNEIMFDPDTLEYYCEYVELKNISTDTIDISGYRIGNKLEQDELLLTNGAGQILVPPLAYVLILDPGYLEHDLDVYELPSNSNLVLCTLNDNAFCRYGLSNSVDDTLQLLDATGQLVDSYQYSCNNLPGYSDERVDELQSYWKNSKLFRGTPGKRNSVAKPLNDLSFGKILKTNNSWNISLINTGLLSIEMPCQVVVGIDFNENHLMENEEILEKFVIQTIALHPNDSLEVDIPFQNNFSGEMPFLFHLEIEDGDTLNNTKEIMESFKIQSDELKINEIMFNSDVQGEWIELYNNGNRIINISRLLYSDLKDSLNLPTFFIQPKSYAILCDSKIFEQKLNGMGINALKINWLTLNNDVERLSIRDSAGHVLDEVYYENKYIRPPAQKNVSLERINLTVSGRDIYNWASSQDPEGSTPGYKNSVQADAVKPFEKAFMEFSPNPFSPDGDGFEDLLKINVMTSFELVNGSIKIFDLKGILRKEWHLSNRPGQFTLIWDGRDKNQNQLPLGIYVVMIEITNRRDGKKWMSKKTLVLTYKK